MQPEIGFRLPAQDEPDQAITLPSTFAVHNEERPLWVLPDLLLRQHVVNVALPDMPRGLAAGAGLCGPPRLTDFDPFSDVPRRTY